MLYNIIFYYAYYISNTSNMQPNANIFENVENKVYFRHKKVDINVLVYTYIYFKY